MRSDEWARTNNMLHIAKQRVVASVNVQRAVLFLWMQIWLRWSMPEGGRGEDGRGTNRGRSGRREGQLVPRNLPRVRGVSIWFVVGTKVYPSKRRRLLNS